MKKSGKAAKAKKGGGGGGDGGGGDGDGDGGGGGGDGGGGAQPVYHTILLNGVSNVDPSAKSNPPKRFAGSTIRAAVKNFLTKVPLFGVFVRLVDRGRGALFCSGLRVGRWWPARTSRG